MNPRPEREGMGEDVRSTLMALAETDRLALFVGAAVSRYLPSGLPLGGELRDMVIRNFVAKVIHDPAGFVEIMRLEFSFGTDPIFSYGGAFQCLAPEVVFAHMLSVKLDPIPYIRLVLRQASQPNECHLLLAKILKEGIARCVFTTNFDELIERSAQGELATELLENRPLGSAKPAKLYRLHGTLGKPSSMQASIQQIAQGLSPRKWDFLAEALAECDLLVVGYSGLDPDVFPVIADAARNQVVWVLRPRGEWPIAVKTNQLAEGEKHLAELSERLAGRVTFVATDAFLWLKLLYLANTEPMGAHGRFPLLEWPEEWLRPYVIEDVPTPKLSQVYELLGRLHLAAGNIDISDLAFQRLVGLAAKGCPEAYPAQQQRAFNFHASIQHLRDAIQSGPDIDLSQQLREVFWGVPPIQHGTPRVSFVPKDEPIQELSPSTPEAEYRRLCKVGQLDDALSLYFHRLHTLLFHEKAAYSECIELLGLLFDDLRLKPGFEDERYAAEACNLLGASYAATGQPAEAIRLYEQHLDLTAHTAGLCRNLAIGLNNRAECEIDLGKLHDAQLTLKYCINIASQVKADDQVAIARRSLGLVFALIGEDNGAERQFQLSLDLFRSLGRGTRQSQSIVWCWRTLNHCLSERWADAIRSAKAAKKLAASQKLPRDLARAGWVKGLALEGDGRYNESKDTLMYARNLCKSHNIHALLPAVLVGLGQVAIAIGELENARNLVTQALRISNAGSLRLRQAEAHLLLAQICLKDQNWQSAATHAASAVERAACGYKHLEIQTRYLAERIAAEQKGSE